jgi:hypothetical protein
MSDSAASNPFCTRFFRPGAIPFYFQPPMSLDALVHQIVAGPHSRVAIVGPHGSGKSTLLQDVIEHPELSRADRMTSHVRFQQGAPRRARWRTMLPALAVANRNGGGLLIVDGWEQLDRVLQWVVRSRAASKATRILATSHTLPGNFVELWQTRIDPGVESHVLGHMLRGSHNVSPAALILTEAWRESRRRHGSNLRESLFDMYDWYRDRVDVHAVGR